MNAQSYVIFQLGNLYYGIPAIGVQEIFFLPEIVQVAENSAAFLGVINLRGELLPVLDLYQQIGQSHPPFQLTDSVIVLEWQTQKVGIVVSQVHEVQGLAADQVTVSLSNQSATALQDRLVMGVATVADGMITLLNSEWLVHYAQAKAGLYLGFEQNPTSNLPHGGIHSRLTHELYHHFDRQARQTLQERTATLKCPISEQASAELMPLAVVGLGGEYFGFDLETVHEFTEIHKITPVPCCPPHILGNINLRGEIVTLINISDVIDLPITSVRSQPQAVVVRLDQRVAGITVDDIFDVTYIHPSQMIAAPIAMHSAKDDYLQGVVPYQDKMMSIINLSKLLTSDVLVVNEEV